MPLLQQICKKSCYSAIQVLQDPARMRSSYSKKPLPRVFFAAEKFVPFDRGDNADGAFVARLGPLNAAEAAHANGPSQGDFVWQGQKNFDGRAFPDVFGKKEVDTARTDVAGFGAGLANRGARSPTDGERQPHLEALSCAAFGTGQGMPPDRSQSVSGSGPGNNRTAGTKSIQFWKVRLY